MALASDKFASLAIPKTGSTWLRKLYGELGLSLRTVGDTHSWKRVQAEKDLFERYDFVHHP